MRSLLFISTNSMWSGSEELWARSAHSFIQESYSVAFATKFEHPELNKLNARYINFANRYSSKTLIQRGIERFSNYPFKIKDKLKEFIREISPELVIISQGNNYESLEIMQICNELKLSYVTITQLVSDLFIWISEKDNFLKYQKAYLGAIKNFFVSKNNLSLNNFILGCELPNAEVTYNPCKLSKKDITVFPDNDNEYCIGMVGRIECWHKGYDLFLQVINQDKWKERPVYFNMYGEGPHSEFIKRYISHYGLSNLTLKGYSNDVRKIWQDNQILLMPSRHEGQALALIEAMWCQRAAIVTNVGGAAELIEEGHNGFIADTATFGCIDAALERAWAQRSQWKQMGLKAAATLNTKYPPYAVDFFNQQIKIILVRERS